MKKLILMAIVAALVVPAMASPTIDFEDLDPANWEYYDWDSGDPRPDPYQGFTWGWTNIATRNFLAGMYPGISVPSQMGDRIAFTDGASAQLMDAPSGSSFDLVSVDLLYWTGIDESYDAHSVTVEGYWQGNLMATQTAGIFDSFLTMNLSGFTGLDEFRLVGYGGGGLGDYFLFDNIVLSNVNVIPAPGAILLVGIGTSVVGWLRRRRMI